MTGSSESEHQSEEEPQRSEVMTYDRKTSTQFSPQNNCKTLLPLSSWTQIVIFIHFFHSAQQRLFLCQYSALLFQHFIEALFKFLIPTLGHCYMKCNTLEDISITSITAGISAKRWEVTSLNKFSCVDLQWQTRQKAQCRQRVHI